MLELNIKFCRKTHLKWRNGRRAGEDSVSRSFECEIATPAFKNRHKIATQKFLKIATFLAQIATFVSNNVEKWSSFYFHCIFMWQSFWKMWHFRRKSGILSWQNQIDGVYTSIRSRGVRVAGNESAWAARAGKSTCRSTCIKINFETNFQKSQTTNLYM